MRSVGVGCMREPSVEMLGMWSNEAPFAVAIVAMAMSEQSRAQKWRICRNANPRRNRK